MESRTGNIGPSVAIPRAGGVVRVVRGDSNFLRP